MICLILNLIDLLLKNQFSQIVFRRQKLKNVFQERNQKVRDVCKEESENIPKLLAKEAALRSGMYNIEHKHKLLMCRAAKHGTTTWAYNFIQMYKNG